MVDAKSTGIPSSMDKPTTPVIGGGGEHKIQLSWEVDSQIGLNFVEHIQVQVFNEAVYLTFGQVTVPVNFDPVANPTGTTIRPVARVVMSPGVLRSMAKALSELVDKAPK